MRARSPAFLFFPRQFAADDHVMAMDLDVVGAHILLMCAAAASPEGYRIPADERAMRNRLRRPSEEDWQRIVNQLLAGPWKLSDDKKWWEQDGLRRTFEKQREFSAAQRGRAEARWVPKKPERAPEAYRMDAEKPPNEVPQECSSSSSSNKNIVSDVGTVQGASRHGSPLPGAAAIKVSELLASNILRNNPSARITRNQLQQWAVVADRMMRLDGRTEEEITNLIEWSQMDGFWFKNILSMSKLREQFDRLTLARRSARQGVVERDSNAEDTPSGPPQWSGLPGRPRNGSLE